MEADNTRQDEQIDNLEDAAIRTIQPGGKIKGEKRFQYGLNGRQPEGRYVKAWVRLELCGGKGKRQVNGEQAAKHGDDP